MKPFDEHPRYQEMLVLQRKIIADSYSELGVSDADREQFAKIWDEICPDRHSVRRWR